MSWIATAVGALVALLVVQVLHLAIVFAWTDHRTVGLSYYGRPKDARDRFKRSLRLHAMLLSPILHLFSWFSKFTFAKASFTHDGITGPRGTCSPESFAAAGRYEPTPDDVFVVTQMKCGTTWMQHVVYETLMRGAGDLVQTGRTLYAVSPWLEARTSVSVVDAPRIGSERRARIIKTHLPVTHCPFDAHARYVYVVRHPLSCFASCADFIAANAGPFAPPLETIERWYCSDDMWWTGWPRHVAGWWERSQRDDNVLFLRFEDMKDDLAAVVGQVTQFLGLTPLNDAELRGVLEKCSFGYMQRHKGSFEMHPPHLLATDADLFVSGTGDRFRDVPAALRHRVAVWCAKRLRDEAVPFEGLYPDLASMGTADGSS